MKDTLFDFLAGVKLMFSGNAQLIFSDDVF